MFIEDFKRLLLVVNISFPFFMHIFKILTNLRLNILVDVVLQHIHVNFLKNLSVLLLAPICFLQNYLNLVHYITKYKTGKDGRADDKYHFQFTLWWIVSISNCCNSYSRVIEWNYIPIFLKVIFKKLLYEFFLDIIVY